MLLTFFLSVVVCGAVSLIFIACIAFIQDIKMFSSAPKEARDVLIPRDRELFCGARTIGWVLMTFGILMILGAFAISLWDGIRSGFTFWQFFIRLVIMFTVYKLYDMILICLLLQIPFLKRPITG